MPSGRPNPISMTILTPEQAGVERRVLCRQYDECLDYADRLKFPGFSCAECSVQDEMTREEAREDFEGLARLLIAMVDGPADDWTDSSICTGKQVVVFNGTSSASAVQEDDCLPADERRRRNGRWGV